MIALVVLAQLAVSWTMPADIVPRAPGEWAIVPGAIPPGGFSLVELRYAPPSAGPVVLLKGQRLAAEFDLPSGYLRAALPRSGAFDTVTVLSHLAPLYAAYTALGNSGIEGGHTTWLGEPIWIERMSRGPQEPFDSSLTTGWVFRQGAFPPEWGVEGAGTEAGESFLTVRSDGTGRIVTSRGFGLRACDHPVAVIQYRVNSGIGATIFEWISDDGSSGHMTVPVNQWGDWVQLGLPLHRHSAWRGEIRALSFRPIDHPAVVDMDWIAFPSLASGWALLLRSAAARWIAVGALIVILAVALRTAKLTNPTTLMCAGACASACSVILLPYPELMPGFDIGHVGVPWYLVPLAGIAAWGVRGGRWDERAALGCAAFTLAHGAIVARGACLETALSLTAVPLAYAAGAFLRRIGCAVPAVVALSCVVAASGLHAILFRDPAHDPLYGTLSATLGRAYGDVVREGRAGGAFVHPLAFAMTTSTIGTALLAAGRQNSVILGLGVLTIASGIATLSRAYFALVAAGTAWLFRYRWRVLCAVGVVLLVAGVAGGRGSQGVWRNLHMGRRMAGIQVAARTLWAKPLQGVGWGRYERAARRFGPPVVRARPYTTPDNTYARLLAEGGIFGGGAWLGWLFAAGCAAAGRRTSWVPPAAPFVCLLVMWAVFDGAYWPAAVPSSLAMGLAVDRQ